MKVFKWKFLKSNFRHPFLQCSLAVFNCFHGRIWDFILTSPNFSSFFLIVIPLFEKNPYKNGSKQRSLRKVSRFSEPYFAQKNSSCAIILYTIRLDPLKQKIWIDFPADFSLVPTPNTLPKTLHDIPKNP